jgi:hypothetical protein
VPCRLALVVALTTACSTGRPPELPPDASAIDAGSPPDAGAFADARPYETIPPCEDPAFWALAPNSSFLAGVQGGCTSAAQPLGPLFVFALRYLPSPDFERICYRVTEANDSGWTVGAVTSCAADEAWTGYVAGRSPLLAFEVRAVFEGGWLSSLPRASYEGASGLVVAREARRIVAVSPFSTYLTETEVVQLGEPIAAVEDPRALFLVDYRTTWIDRTADGLVVSTASGRRDGPITRQPISGTGDVVMTARLGSWTVLAIDEVLYILTASGPDAPIDGLSAPAETLSASPAQLVGQAAGSFLLVRIGDQARPMLGGSLEWDALLDSGVERLVEGPSPYVLREGVLYPMVIDITRDPYFVSLDLDAAIPLDPRIGEPLMVLGDGRVFGTAGTAGPPVPQSPDFVSTEAAFGGTIEAFAVGGDDSAWATIAVATPEEHVVLELGSLHPDACGR